MKARHNAARRPFSDEFTQVVVDFHDIESTGWMETGTFRPVGKERNY
jgi:hypothetical protein